MSYRFTAIENFSSPETKSEYVKDMSYTVRDGNDKLAKLVETWVAEKKVVLGGPAAKVSGQAVIEDKKG